MAYITVTNIKIDQPIASLSEQINVTVKFDCLKSFVGKLTFEVVYVASAKNKAQDQVLDRISLEEVEYGVNEFDWAIDPPKYEELDNIFDVFDTTVIMVLAYVNDNEFFRCSYLLRHEYKNQEHIDNPPEEFKFEDLERKIGIEKPMIAISDVDWNKLVAA